MQHSRRNYGYHHCPRSLQQQEISQVKTRRSKTLVSGSILILESKKKSPQTCCAWQSNLWGNLIPERASSLERRANGQMSDSLPSTKKNGQIWPLLSIGQILSIVKQFVCFMMRLFWFLFIFSFSLRQNHRYGHQSCCSRKESGLHC